MPFNSPAFILCFSLFILFFEFPVSIFVFRLFKSLTSEITLFIHPFNVFFLLYSAFYLRNIHIPKRVLYSFLLLLIPVFWQLSNPCSLASYASDVYYARFLLFGALPIILGSILACLPSMFFRPVIKTIIVSSLLLGVVYCSFYLYDLFGLISSHIASPFFNLRYYSSLDLEKPPLVSLFGNFNKFSNVLVFCMLAILTSRAFSVEGFSLRRITFFSLVALQLANIATLSKGGLLCSFLIGVFLLSFNKKFAPVVQNIPVLVCLYLLPVFVFIFSVLFADIDSAGLASIDSLYSRLDQWSQIDIPKLDFHLNRRSLFVLLSVFLFGYGPTHYGVTVFDSYASGTHNAFIDLFLGYGILGLLGYVLLILPSFCFVFAKASLPLHLVSLQFLVFVCIVILSFRELSLAYLGVSSLISLLFGFLSSVGLRRSYS